jgi:signal transduction histidine kinase
MKMSEIDTMLPLSETSDQISAAYSGIVRNTMISLAIATLLLGFFIVKFRERDLQNDKRRLETSVLERTLEIHNKNQEIQAQAEEINAINQNLELLVKERTTQLERKNKALEEFAFITAHNLRAPLASILGLINLTSSIKFEENEKVILEHLHLSAKKLDAIVHSMTEAIEAADEVMLTTERTYKMEPLREPS